MQLSIVTIFAATICCALYVNCTEETPEAKRETVPKDGEDLPLLNRHMQKRHYGRSTSGVVYTRWGHNSCPGGRTLVYTGSMAGSFHSHEGGGSNYLCLPEVPQYDNSVYAGKQLYRGYVYHVEYRGRSGPLNSKRYNDLPCAVCLQEQRNNYIMYPARKDCPSGWTREYYGYLMSSKYNQATSEYVCVDVSGGILTGTSSAVNGASIYPVESRCSRGSGLPCAPYVDGYELTCAVCSK
ncbi:short-chain collagen C4-like [Ptychodera flava]|uniref:short-chain collagen C4-like n=1 Tax=Ptychodera flava TaxID=63121 RepID=UPI00396A37A4